MRWIGTLGGGQSSLLGAVRIQFRALDLDSDNGWSGHAQGSTLVSLLAGDDDKPQQNANPPVVQEIIETTDVILGSTATSFTLAIGASERGVVNFVGDDDYFRVNLVAGQSYVFTMTTDSQTTNDAYLELYNPDGQIIAYDDDGGPGALMYNSLLRYTATTTGTYYLNARAYEASGFNNTGDYTVAANLGPAQNPLDAINLGYTAPLNIQVYFATNGQTHSFSGTSVTAIQSWTVAEQNAAMQALATYAAIAPFTFSVTTDESQAEFILTLADLDTNVLGWFASSGGLGYGAFAPDVASWTTAGGLSAGGAGFATLIHEFGHALGLAHPHDNGGVSEVMQGVLAPFSSFGTYQLNQGIFTTMSYNDGYPLRDGFNNNTSGSQATPMALDIALIQQRYGTNGTFNNGNNTYTLTGVNGPYVGIWDTGGTDTISYTGNLNATIDLRTATLLNEIGGGGYVSFAGFAQQGFTIAAGVVIENAVGGAGTDTMTGNAANNTFTGNGNSDTINGGLGVDTAVYTSTSTTATWSRNVAGVWTVTTPSDGSDDLTSVERVHFTDRDYALDNAQQTFSGNGTSDLLWRNSNHGTVVVWDVTGATQNSATIAGGAPSNWNIVGVGDINGDGRDDLLWQNNVDGGVAGWLMNGGTPTAIAMVGGAPAVWQIAGMGDFNFDGRDDFVWRNTSDGSVAVWLMNGLTSHADAIISGAPLAWGIAAVADFDGDGRDDILLRHTDGTLARWTTDGTTQTGAAIVGSAPAEWQIAGTGDFDRDGRADILWRNTTDGGIAIWRMDGGTQLGSAMIGAAPLAWGIEDVGDYNGDGRDDILLRHTDGTVALWTMNGFTVANVQIIGLVPPDWDLV